MRIYSNAYQLMSETGRNLWEMGIEVKPKTYQNMVIDGMDDFITKELICEQYCLTGLPDEDILFTHTNSKMWAKRELEERLSGETLNPGRAWEFRSDVWEQFLVQSPNLGSSMTTAIFDYTYPERINQESVYQGKIDTKLNNVIKLLKDDNDTRKAILNIYGEYHSGKYTREYDCDRLDGKQRIPCSMYYDFLIRENAKGEKQLNMCYHQRSSDFIVHFGNDVYLAWFTMVYVANKVGVKPGYLYHTIDSLHAYKKDWGILKSSIGEIKR